MKNIDMKDIHLDEWEYEDIREWYCDMSDEERLLVLLELPNADIDKIIYAIDTASYVAGYEAGQKMQAEDIKDIYRRAYKEGIEDTIKEVRKQLQLDERTGMTSGRSVEHGITYTRN